MSTAVTRTDPDPNPDLQPGEKGGKRRNRPERPESVQLAIRIWLGALILELVHQILQVVSALIDPSELLYAAQQQQEQSDSPEMAEEVINFATYSSIIGLGVINLIFVAILFVALHFYASRHRLVGGARSLLMVFSLFFALRGILTFGAIPAGTNVPDWLLLLDGSLVIVIAVVAVLGVIFSSRQEALDYTGENPTGRDENPQNPTKRNNRK